MKALNEYRLPMKIGEFSEIDRTTSPAHVGKLKNSVDFLCEEGMPVYAALDGKVVWLKDDSDVGGPDKKHWNDGNRVVIKHVNGEYSAYEHLRFKGVAVGVGEDVETGQLIGYSGNTGYTFAPHLHFEIFRLTGPNTEEDFETLEVRFKELVEGV